MPRRRRQEPPVSNPYFDSLAARHYRGGIAYNTLIKYWKPDTYVGGRPQWSLETLNRPPSLWR